MNDLLEQESQAAYQCWSQTVAGVLAWQLNLFQTQYHVGFRMVEVALGIPGGAATPVRETALAPAATLAEKPAEAPCAVDRFQNLESVAFERTRKGLAPPHEIYDLPYRDRVDWSKFPDWARPIDPEVFQDSGHEG